MPKMDCKISVLGFFLLNTIYFLSNYIVFLFNSIYKI